MIVVEPGKTFQFKNPNTPEHIDEIVRQVTRLIRESAPFISGVQVFNQTKSCAVTVNMEDHKIVIRIQNPKDSDFDLNEYGDAKPMTMTGR